MRLSLGIAIPRTSFAEVPNSANVGDPENSDNRILLFRFDGFYF